VSETLVFAYGSNLLAARLRERVGRVRLVTTATLAEHALRWHKRSLDGSAKCDAFETGEAADVIWGVVYAIDTARKPDLDGAEGLGKGYDEGHATVMGRDSPLRVILYRAAQYAIDPALKPYTWYKALVAGGARRCGLPPDYVARIQVVEAIEDPDPERAGRHWRLVRQ
jgi:hypothetical protein